MSHDALPRAEGGPLALVVDDDGDMRSIIGSALREAGLRTIEVDDAEKGIEAVRRDSPEIVLLDVGLGPDSLGGLEACRRIRQTNDVPVVFLSVDYSDMDRLAGLRAGADEYLAKPIAPRLLSEYVLTVLRRARSTTSATSTRVLTEGGISIDLDSRVVTVNGKQVDLTRTQFDLLAALAEHPRRVLTRAQLIERVWGAWYGSDHHLDVHISRLRAAIEAAGGPRVPFAVRGVGFRFSE